MTEEVITALPITATAVTRAGNAALAFAHRDIRPVARMLRALPGEDSTVTGGALGIIAAQAALTELLAAQLSDETGRTTADVISEARQMLTEAIS